MARSTKTHLLSDGSEWTVAEMVKASGASIATIRARLWRTKDIKVVLAKTISLQGKTCKVYTLSDGSEWTVNEIVKKTGATRSCIGARLHKSLDINKVLQPARKTPIDIETVSMNKSIKARMFFDDRPFWKLMAKIGVKK